jgi:hypothetical protein
MIGRIYIIQSPNTDKVYIGSTILSLKARFRVHNHRNTTTSKIITDAGDAYIELLEEVKVIDEPELRYYENQYLELYRDIAVNENSPFGIDKDKRKISSKKSREKNPEKIYESLKKYREKNPEKIRAIDKKYFDKNIEQIRERKKERAKIKIECPCGSVISKPEEARHRRTKKHQKYLENVAQQ